jgi:superfamily II DNA helicase RecQ
MPVPSKPERPKRRQMLLHISYSPNENLELDAFTCAVIAKTLGLLGCHCRDWQAAAIRILMRHKDIFVKAGTGSGKSLVVLSMMASKENGIAFILVPLKSIMDDQVRIFVSSFDQIGL